MKLVHPTKIITKLGACFAIAFIPLPSFAFQLPVIEWPDFEIAIITMSDPAFVTAIGFSSNRADLIAGELDTIKNEMTTKALPAVKIYKTNAEKVKKAVIEELNANTEWVEKNKPNINYATELGRMRSVLSTAASVSDKKLEDIEYNYFNNQDALINMSKVYGKNNQKYEDFLLENKPFCPPVAPTVQGIPTIGVSYTMLQTEVCETVYNAIAYKEAVNRVLAEKDAIIEDATNDTIRGIIKLPSKTIGDHNARQTALETLRLLRKIAINDNDIKLHNAEAEAEISQQVRQYTTNAILTGPPKQAGDEIAFNAAKLVLGTVLGTAINTVAPYNQ